MLTLLLLASCALPPIEVEVRPLTGDTYHAEVIGVSADRLRLEGDTGETTEVTFASLLSVTPTEAVDAELQYDHEPLAWIELMDGSELVADSYVVEDRQARIVLYGGGNLSFDTSLVRAVRFHAQDGRAAIRQQWQAILDMPLGGDAVVVRRGETVQTLDHLEGVITAVTTQAVHFEFDDNRVEIPREKLEGFIYFRTGAKASDDPICRVVQNTGTTWFVKSLALRDETWAVESTCGVRTEIGWPQIAKLDFACGNLVFLSDLELETVKFTPFFASRLPDGQVSSIFEPRMDRALGGGPLLLGGKSYEKGLSVHSRTQWSYRLPEQYRRLQALVGIDDRVRSRGDVYFTIRGDDKVLFEQTITGADEPLSLDLEIDSVRRLTFLVDYGNGLDIADHLNLCNARLIK